MNKKNIIITFLLIVIILLLIFRPTSTVTENIVIKENLQEIDEYNDMDIERIIDGSNIILAIQDYYYQTDTFPKDLPELRKKGLLNEKNNLEDPEYNTLYYYEKREVDFVFCVLLSNGVRRGFNTKDCSTPIRIDVEEKISLEEEVTKEEKESSLSEEQPMNEISTTNMIEITVDSSFVRSGAGSENSAIASVYKGEKYTVIERKNDWYYIKINTNTKGWISGKNTTEVTN